MNGPTGLQLVWNGKDKIINHHNEIPFRILKEIKNKSFKKNVENSTENIIIKGDNLEGLKALKPYFYESIKMVYIDPPYNTGERQGSGGWVFSDNVNSPEIKKWFNKTVGGESEDYSRHTKWLCMMYPRLKLLYELIREDGIIFISIDDNELHHLRLIMNEIFGGSNFISIFVRKTSSSPRMDAKYVSTEHDYIVCYAKNKEKLKINFIDSANDASYNLEDKHVKIRGRYKLNKLDRGSIRYSEKLVYPIQAPDKTLIYPGGIKGRNNWTWRWNPDKVEWGKKADFIVFKKNSKNKWSVYFKQYQFCDNEGNIIKREYPYRTILDGFFNEDGKKILERIFGKKVFDYPKPVKLIKHLLKIGSGKKDIILDSFAGSGTTGHAVLELNKEDGGDRKFIMIQLDEGKLEKKFNIADIVTAERIRRVIKGYSYKSDSGKITKVNGLGGRFKYYEVNGTLKDEKGFINSLISNDELAKFIMFIETEESQTKPAKLDDFKIGEKNNVVFYFIHDKSLLLDNSFLERINYEKLKKDGRFVVVYAYGSLLDDDYLSENMNSLRFMQIPNSLESIAKI